MHLLNDGKQFHIFKTAVDLFLEKSFGQTSMEDVAAAADMPADEIYKFFGNKEDIVFHLYRIINNDWETEVAGIQAQKLPERFREAMIVKLQLIAPYKHLLTSLLPILLNDDALGVFSKENKVTRAQGLSIMMSIVSESKGFSKKHAKQRELAKTLYLFHWSLLFLSLHETNNSKTLKLLDAFTAWLSEMSFTKQLLLPFVLPKIAEVSDIVLDEADDTGTQAKAILDIIFSKRKLLPDSNCDNKSCEHCYSIHLPRVQYFIDQQQPVHIILPAFPAKSPNLDKVLGTLPDLGEEIALLTLQGLCEEISRVYKPGARITICADGRIFADLVQVSDENVTAYTAALRSMIDQLQLSDLDIVNLEDLVTGMNFDEARRHIIDEYAEDMNMLSDKINQIAQYRMMFNGIHRFISDDRLYTEREKSKTKIKEESKEIAIGVIQRSNAWTRFLSHYYPSSLRLSIHPQPAHSEKIGIRLTRATDEWITPWHGVIVLAKDNYTLMKRRDAAAMKAHLVFKNNRPDHYTLNHPKP